MIQNDVEALLRSPSTRLNIRDYAGNNKMLNSRVRWSRDDGWADKGIFVRA